VRDPVLVIVPTRDRPTMLAEALRSLVAQSDRDWTAVVADDGEAETAAEVVGALGVGESVAVVRTDARSPGGARNAAFAHGETAFAHRRARWLAFLDDDDLWLPLHLASVRRALEASPEAVFVHTGAITRAVDSVASYHERDAGADGAEAFRALLARNAVATSSVATSADRFRAAGGFRADLLHGEDWDLWLRLAREGPVAFVPEPTVVYRAHGGNTSGDLAAKAADQAKALEPWWEKRALLSRPERRTLARSLARRHASHVRRLLREGAPRSEARRVAREHFRRLPRLRTLLAAMGPRGR
jgi:glycosyltransferase involved in cell wall biosynthesis